MPAELKEPLRPDQVDAIEDALESARLTLVSLDGLEIRYSASDVRPGHFAREIKMLDTALSMLGGAK